MEIPVYVVSLKNAVERREYIKSMMADFGVHHEVIDAVYGKHLPSEDKKSVNPAQNLKDGEIGCFLSHLICYEKFISTGKEYAVVIEDDTQITNEFVELLKTEIPAECVDFLFLLVEDHGSNGFVYQIKQSERNIGRFSVFELTSPPYSTNAYVISRRAAKIMLEKNVTINAPIDHYKNVRGEFKFHAVRNSICFMNNLASLGSITSEAWSPLMIYLRKFSIYYLFRDLCKLRFIFKYREKIKMQNELNSTLKCYRSGFRVSK